MVLRPRLVAWLATIGLSLSLCANVLLYSRATTASTAAATPAPLAPGARLDALRVKSVSGNPVTIDYASVDLPTLLYVINPACVWCERNFEAIKSVASQARSRYRVVGVSVTRQGLPELLKKSPYPFPMHTDLEDAQKRAYVLERVPQTIVIGTNGEVRNVWFGAFRPEMVPEIEAALGVSIPPAILPQDPRLGSLGMSSARLSR